MKSLWVGPAFMACAVLTFLAAPTSGVAQEPELQGGDLVNLFSGHATGVCYPLQELAVAFFDHFLDHFADLGG